MSTLSNQLGLDLTSPSQLRAIVLTENDAAFLRDLVELRVRLGLTQKEVAERLGISQASIASFERYDNDPKLSTVRRYAHAVGALISHAVEEDRGLEVGHADWRANAVVRTSMHPRRGAVARTGWESRIA